MFGSIVYAGFASVGKGLAQVRSQRYRSWAITTWSDSGLVGAPLLD